MPDGSKLPTDFNEGEASNYMARKQRMIGYSFEHAFNDTWAVRQNLRYMQDTDMEHLWIQLVITDDDQSRLRSVERAPEQFWWLILRHRRRVKPAISTMRLLVWRRLFAYARNDINLTMVPQTA